MTSITHGADGVSSRRAQIERLLADYPYVDSEQIADLNHWFLREATALEVGMIASEPELAKPYQRFKADHLERFQGADLVWAAIFVMFLCSIFALMAVRAM